MLNQFSRTQLLFGPEAMERLQKYRVAVFGIGGVGGYAVEALVRSGIGTLDTRDQFDFTRYDYVIDAIDTVTGKLSLIEAAKEAGTPIICSMGAGNKTDPTAFRVADIYQTSVCPLARVIRRECRKRKIKHLKVVYSTEQPVRPLEDPAISCRSHCICPPGTRKCTVRRDIPGSTAFVPSVAGLIIAGEVIKDLAGYGKDERNNT